MTVRFPDDTKDGRQFTTEQLISFCSERVKLHESTKLEILVGIAIACALFDINESLDAIFGELNERR